MQVNNNGNNLQQLISNALSKISHLTPSSTKIWLYTSNRTLTQPEQIAIQQEIDTFCSTWSSHSIGLKSAGEIIHNEFLLLAVDEDTKDASGCSIDKSLHFIQQLEKKYTLSLLNRKILKYYENNTIHTTDFDTFITQKSLPKDKDIAIFNPLVSSLQDFEQNFIQPLHTSWITKLLTVTK